MLCCPFVCFPVSILFTKRPFKSKIFNVILVVSSKVNSILTSFEVGTGYIFSFSLFVVSIDFVVVIAPETLKV
jgi:hypothetical protein